MMCPRACARAGSRMPTAAQRCAAHLHVRCGPPPRRQRPPGPGCRANQWPAGGVQSRRALAIHQPRRRRASADFQGPRRRARINRCRLAGPVVHGSRLPHRPRCLQRPGDRWSRGIVGDVSAGCARSTAEWAACRAGAAYVSRRIQKQAIPPVCCTYHQQVKQHLVPCRQTV